jgi:hypothetical protein
MHTPAADTGEKNAAFNWSVPILGKSDLYPIKVPIGPGNQRVNT